jgi:hypothetical protein
MFGLVRQPSTPTQRKLSVAFVASDLLFIVIGFVVGSSVATSNRLAVAVFAALAGGLVWMLCCWTLAIVIWAWRRGRAHKELRAGPTP